MLIHFSQAVPRRSLTSVLSKSVRLAFLVLVASTAAFLGWYAELTSAGQDPAALPPARLSRNHSLAFQCRTLIAETHTFANVVCYLLRPELPVNTNLVVRT